MNFGEFDLEVSPVLTDSVVGFRTPVIGGERRTALSSILALFKANLGAITVSSVNGVVLSGTATPALTVNGTASVAGVNTGDQDLSAYLLSSTAAATYLTIANAAATYLTQALAASTYLTIALAASTYLTQANAASTYLTQLNAAALYQPVDADLSAIAALSTTSYGRSVLVQADAAALRSYMVLGDSAVLNAGVALGTATLDSGGKVPESQLPDSILGALRYQGTWNAATNTPTLVDPPAASTKGFYYVTTVAGSFAGISFSIGDWIISDGTAWSKVDNTDAVTTVFGRLGNVVANAGDYTATQITNTPAGGISAVTVQAALNELDTEKQPLDAALTALAGGSDFVQFSGPSGSTKVFTLPNASATILTDSTVVTVVQGGTGRATGATAYGLIAAGTTATGAQQTLPAGATTELLVGGGASALPVWTTATGSGAPVRATSPTLVTPEIGVATGSSLSLVALGTSTLKVGSVSARIEMGYSAALTANYLESLNPAGGAVDMVYYLGAANVHRFYVAGALVAAVSNTGLVVTGVSSATTAVSVQNGSMTNPVKLIGMTGAEVAYGALTLNNSTTFTDMIGLLGGGGSDTGLYLTVPTGGQMHFVVGGSDKGGYNSSGLLVTGLITVTGSVVANFNGASLSGGYYTDTTNTNNAAFLTFSNASSVSIGSVTRVGTTNAVVYNTTSDGRLKTNVRPFSSESGAILDGLMPCWFNWVNGGPKTIGFIAQEMARNPLMADIGAVTPPSADDGLWQRSDIPLVPILVAEVKQLRARVAQLESLHRN